MPLSEPPATLVLRRLPSTGLAGTVLHRVYRRGRSSPWWFASVAPGDDPRAHGRFDLPVPHGACYLGTSPLPAALEAFQDFGRGLLPDVELRRRCRAAVEAPPGAPRAAQLTGARARGAGVTAALWAGQDRPLTQRCAAALHRAGWAALYHGIQHDPTGRLRAVSLFDRAGEHVPYDDPEWRHAGADLHDDEGLRQGLARYGIVVTRSDPDLPVVSLDDSGLL